MQNRYTGDIGDFAKYHLLRSLTGILEGEGQLSLGIVWYLVPDDHDRHDQDDGKHIGYLGLRRTASGLIDAPRVLDQRLKELDPQLFEVLRGLVVTGQRDVDAVMGKSLYAHGTEAYSAYPGGNGEALLPSQFRERESRRQQWCENLCEKMNQDIIFLDPDNGVSLPDFCINISVSAGKRNAVKYVLADELTRFYGQAKKALVVYHHLNRQCSHAEQVERLVNAVQKHLDSPQVTAVRCNRGSGRVYLIAEKPRADLSDRIDTVQQSFIRSGLER